MIFHNSLIFYLIYLRYVSEFISETCTPLDPLENGKISYTNAPINGRHLIGAEAIYSCNQGYTFSGFIRGWCHYGEWKFTPIYDLGQTVLYYSDPPRCNGKPNILTSNIRNSQTSGKLSNMTLLSITLGWM